MTASGFKDQLYDFAVVEVAPDELAIGLVFFEGGDGEMGGCHDGFADGGDTGKEVLGVFGLGAWEGFDEDDAVVGVGLVRVEALDAERHGGGSFCTLSVRNPGAGQPSESKRYRMRPSLLIKITAKRELYSRSRAQSTKVAL